MCWDESRQLPCDSWKEDQAEMIEAFAPLLLFLPRSCLMEYEALKLSLLQACRRLSVCVGVRVCVRAC